jgi:hypothetical protein
LFALFTREVAKCRQDKVGHQVSKQMVHKGGCDSKRTRPGTKWCTRASRKWWTGPARKQQDHKEFLDFADAGGLRGGNNC